jgi:hypothetical protein
MAAQTEAAQPDPEPELETLTGEFQPPHSFASDTASPSPTLTSWLRAQSLRKRIPRKRRTTGR